MKFKRDWPIILRDIVFTILFISTLVTCIVLIPLFRSGQLGFFEVFLLLSFCGIIVLTYYFAGVFSNIIILNENGITLLQRKKNSCDSFLEFNYKNITNKIYRWKGARF